MSTVQQGSQQRQAPREIPHGETQFRPKPANPWLAASLEQFRHADDGRKWKVVCRQKRAVVRAYALLGMASTAREISKYQGICVSRVDEINHILKDQEFMTNGKRTYRREPDGRRDFRSERQPRILHLLNLAYYS
jgi:hypothetical protein